MRTVHKYGIQVDDSLQDIQMPKDSTILHVDQQRNDLFLWAEVRTDRKTETRTFIVHGTGHSIDHDGHYVGTVMSAGGQLVWHVYEVVREREQ